MALKQGQREPHRCLANPPAGPAPQRLVGSGPQSPPPLLSASVARVGAKPSFLGCYQALVEVQSEPASVQPFSWGSQQDPCSPLLRALTWDHPALRMGACSCQQASQSGKVAWDVHRNRSRRAVSGVKSRGCVVMSLPQSCSVRRAGVSELGEHP